MESGEWGARGGRGELHCLLKLKYTKVYPNMIPAQAVQNVDVTLADFTEQVIISVPDRTDTELESCAILKPIIECTVF